MKGNYLQKFARVISTIFIPPTFTIIAFVYLGLTFESEPAKKVCVIGVAILFGFVLQITSFIFFYRKQFISDVDAKNKNERTIPYFVSILIFIVGLMLMIVGKVSSVSIAFWFCYISNTVFVILINRYLKISIHAMGVSGPLALFLFFIGINALILLPILIAVGWSRIKLKVHSVMEIFAGAIFGFVSVYLQLSLLLNKF